MNNKSLKKMEICNSMTTWKNTIYWLRSCDMKEDSRTAPQWTLWGDFFFLSMAVVSLRFPVVFFRGTWLMRLRLSRSSMMPQLCLSQQEVTPHTSRCEVLSHSTGPRTFLPWCRNLQYDVRLLLNTRCLSYIICLCVQYQNSVWYIKHHLLCCILS